MEPHLALPQNAHLIWKWLKTRGGIAIWNSHDFATLGSTYTTTVNDAEGRPVQTKPNWRAGEIERIITDPAEVIVLEPKIVQRFHVAVRQGGEGLLSKVTDGGSRRIRAAVAKAGDEAWYEFDYGDYENCLILVPGNKTPLVEWIARNPEPAGE